MFIISIIVIIALLYFYFSKNTNNKNIEAKKKNNKNTKTQEQINTKLIKLKNTNKEKNKAKNKVKNKIKNKVKKIKDDLVYLDIQINKKRFGKIIIKLFSNIVPDTCYNFRSLCQNKSYCKSPFHRIIQDFMIQGGDFTQGNGTGGESIWGDKFDDENFNISHDQRYLLSMANTGPNTNGSQFFITTGNASHLDGKHVVFGKVVDGLDIVDYLNEIETGNDDRPQDNVIISDCGVI
jgi:cyclophilin family peptidyl-prolyl cis-trans isomerase